MLCRLARVVSSPNGQARDVFGKRDDAEDQLWFHWILLPVAFFLIFLLMGAVKSLLG